MQCPLILCTLLAAMASAHAHADSNGELSIPEPTQLSVAMKAGAKTVWTHSAGEIRSSDATAVLTAIEVAEQDGQRANGIWISLRNLDSADDLDLSEFELRQFRTELAELESRFAEFASRCEATHSCVSGVARCRPSQTEPQAYCPGIYTTSSFLAGFGLSTTHHSFVFPFVRPEKFLISVDSAVEALDRRESSRQ
jgi:hypothetical protein